MPRATPVEVMTPGRNEQRHRAGALDLGTGRVYHRLWFRKGTGVFLDFLNLVDSVCPARRWDQIDGVADKDKIHKAKLVQRRLQPHPRFRLVFLPPYCARAHPLERCFSDLQDKVTRHHGRKRRRELVGELPRHLAQNGPWHSPWSELYCGLYERAGRCQAVFSGAKTTWFRLRPEVQFGFP
jgi:hypothetical protein